MQANTTARSMARGGLALLVAGMTLVAALGWLPGADAAEARPVHVALPAASTAPATAGGIARMTVPPAPLRRGADDRTTSVVPARATSSDRSLPLLSHIAVTYHGFPSQDQAAFAAAVGIWERLVRSPVTIKVDVTWRPLDAETLAETGASEFLRAFPGAPRTDSWYPSALADARAGRDLEPGQPDIVGTFNSTVDWSTSTTGSPSAGQEDLESSAMHELGHGLGMQASVEIAGGIGSWGNGSPYPFAWDRFITDSNGNPIVDYPNNSAALATALTSGTDRFAGWQATSANHGNRVPLFTPSSFYQSSSANHWDEAAYPRGNANSLMTPYQDYGEIVLDPGDVFLGALRDLGWTTTAWKGAAPGAPTISHISAGNRSAYVYWNAPTGTVRAPISGYRVLVYVGTSSTIDTSWTVGPTKRSLVVPSLQDGTGYRFKVVAFNLVGNGPGSATSSLVRPLDLGPFSNVDSFLTHVYAELLHRSPAASILASRRGQLNSGATSPAATIAQLTSDPTYAGVFPPVIRLYLAYFQRLPDESGLAHWAGQLRSGHPLSHESASFAASPEFARTYGKLTSSAFVDLVYHNVLGRTPDRGGRAHWLAKMAHGTSRGAVMLAFSESNENIRKTADTTAVVSLHHTMVARVPTASAVAADVARLVAHTASLTTLANEIFHSSTYAAHVTGH